jgi:ATP-binding cassette subfamily C protein LapB
VLIGWDHQQRARLLPSETEGGEITVSPETLAENYSGRVIFISPEHEFDAQPTATLPRTTAWFQDTLKLSKFLYRCGGRQLSRQPGGACRPAVRDERL